ncbi:Alpha/Beta hydrolase fold containing protein [Parasponia andersonii]|uniref:Alpha/Beta hydrolase fold containing protein n=1 Tax=Parasponia andersonii TaxID=3476 RepID=A0A2P5DI98_PARAD|nr:Alpha/Beta hydrolase fold containing protein [Parasponia andersonii]
MSQWLVDHPEFNSNPVYVAGDLHSGLIIPPPFPTNLQWDSIIGNPVTDPSDYNYIVSFARGSFICSWLGAYF